MRWRLDPKSLGGGFMLAAVLWIGSASAAERTLVLEVVINGRATGRVGEFIEREGILYARPSELHDLGLVLPGEVAVDGELIALSSLPDMRAQVNEARQTLVVVASDTALRPSEVGAVTLVPLAPLSRASYGALLNYDAAATFADDGATGGALLGLRAFGPYGLLESASLINITPLAGQQTFVRLDTTYTYTQPSRLRRLRLGDVVTGALPWSRAVRLGGAQVASDFGLRPDLVTYPLPMISGSAAVPSTVNVVLNGIRQFSQPVEPGPFTIRALPVVTGAGEVVVTVSDAVGRETLMTLPFYASTALLKPGLASYSLEVGAVRQDYGQASDRYSGWAANLSSRYGLNDWLTLEGHGEAAGGLGLLGGGVAVLVGTFGVANLALAGSVGGGASSGAMVSAGFQRSSRGLNFGVNGVFATNGYRDIAAQYDAAMPRATVNASLGYHSGKWGNIGIAYSGRTFAARPLASLQSSPDDGVFTGRQDLITGSYSIAVAGRATFYATGFKAVGEDGAYGAGIGVSFKLGSAHASVETSVDGGRSSASVTIAKTAQEQNDYGYRLRASEGAAPHRSAEGEFLSRWGRVSAGLDQYSGQVAARAGARGALVLAGGRLFASDQIHDSFAVVSTGDIAGVPVLYENRPVGKTDAAGKLLVSALRSYQDNQLTVDTTRLPPDIEVERTAVLVRPSDRSGVIVDFGVRKVNAALLTLRDKDGDPVPLGSTATVDGAQGQPVGYGGETYVTGLKPTNRMDVVFPDGTRCSAQFDYEPVEGDIPVIGARCL